MAAHSMAKVNEVENWLTACQKFLEISQPRNLSSRRTPEKPNERGMGGRRQGGRGGGNQRVGQEGLDQRRRMNLVQPMEALLTSCKALSPASRLAIKESANEIMIELPRYVSDAKVLEDFLLPSCALISTLTRHVKVPITDDTLDVLVGWLIGLLQYGVDKSHTTVAVLRALSCLLLDNGPFLAKFYPKLISENGVLLDFCELKNQSGGLDTVRMAINCLGNLCSKSCGPRVEKYLPTVFNAVFHQLSHSSAHYRGEGDRSVSKILSSSLRALQYIISSSRRVHAAHMDTLVPSLCSFMFHGLVPSSPFSLCNESATSSYNKALKSAYQERMQLPSRYLGRSDWMAEKVPTIRAISSDSEMSDVDGGEPKRRLTASAIRLNALSCLQTTIKNTARKDTYRFWATVGLTRDSLERPDTLMSAMLHDPDVRVRMGATATLAAFLEGSLAYLSAANDTQEGKRSSFTTFSESLGVTVRHLHEVLVRAIHTESLPPAVCMAAKCLTILVLNSPYTRLRPYLLNDVMASVRTMLRHEDPTVFSAGISCLGAVCSASANEGEVETLLKAPLDKFQLQYSTTSSLVKLGKTIGLSSVSRDLESMKIMENEPNMDKNTIFGGRNLGLQCSTDVMCDSIGDRSLHDLARIEAYTGLTCLARHHIALFSQLWAQKISHTIFILLGNDDHIGIEIEHAASLLEEYVKMLYTLEAIGSPNKECNDGTYKKQTIDLWQALLGGYIQKMFSHPSPHAREAACNLTSYMGLDVFTDLQPMQQRMLVSLLLGLSGDSFPLVKAAACRALGSIVVYPVLRQDAIFAQDMAGAALSNLKDENLAVRVRASWALANLGDALCVEQDPNVAMEGLNASFLLDVIARVSECDKDHDKIRCNIVRCLGTYARLAVTVANQEKLLATTEKKEEVKRLGERVPRVGVEEVGEIMEGCVALLCDSVSHGPVKVRWNACHALGHILQCSATQKWVFPAITALAAILGECKNFKVRINGGISLACIQSRDSLGSSAQLAEIIDKVSNGLEAVNAANDLSEFRYRAQLLDQLYLTVAHLLSLCEPVDFQSHFNVYCRMVTSLLPLVLDFAFNNTVPTFKKDSDDEDQSRTRMRANLLSPEARRIGAINIIQRLQFLLKDLPIEEAHDVIMSLQSCLDDLSKDQ